MLRAAAGFGESPAWHSTVGQEWAQALEAKAAIIQAELLGDSLPEPAAWGGAEYEAIAAEWKFYHLWQDGEWLADAVARYPQTVALLQGLEATHGLRLNPLQNVACGFARQPKGTGIAPHCDGNLLGLTAHLGLQVPTGDDCWIEVGGERRRWQDGKLLLMDTTQTHRTHNGGDYDRYILMLNVLRPQVESREVVAFRHYLRAPPLRLDALNPGWLRVPSGRIACAPAGVDDDAQTVQLVPGGTWEPQRAQGGTDGVVRFEPLHGRRYRVAAGGALRPRELPSEAAPPSITLPPLNPGDELEPCAAAIDADGCLEWLAVPIGSEESSRWLRLTDGSEEAPDAPRDAPLVDVNTLRSHRQLLREPQRLLGWLPVYDEEDEELLVRIE
jgi:hypothetical protein